LLLHHPNENHNLFFCIATSKGERYGSLPGCNQNPACYYIRGNPHTFRSDTWLQLNRPFFELEKSVFQTRLNTRKISRIGILSWQEVNAVVNCAIHNSEDLRQDVISVLKSSKNNQVQ
jgi:hypothetical protein